LHPEQEAQQASDEQQPPLAAFAAPAIPSAMTAINKTTFNFFMISSPLHIGTVVV
jgi:hypothetical protein